MLTKEQKIWVTYYLGNITKKIVEKFIEDMAGSGILEPDQNLKRVVAEYEEKFKIFFSDYEYKYFLIWYYLIQASICGCVLQCSDLACLVNLFDNISDKEIEKTYLKLLEILSANPDNLIKSTGIFMSQAYKK